MATHYCPQCGHPNQYKVKKPSKCEECDGQIEFTPKPNSENVYSIRPIFAEEKKVIKPFEFEIETNEQIKSAGRSTKASFGIESSKPSRFRETIGSLSQQSTPIESRPTIKVDKRKKMDKKAFLNEWQKEAGPLRRENSGNTQEIGE